MEFVLFEDSSSTEVFLPLSYTRPIAHFQLGIFTLFQKWELLLRKNPTLWLCDYRAALFSEFIANKQPTLFINSQVLPTKELVDWLVYKLPKEGAVFSQNNKLLLFCKVQSAEGIKTWQDLYQVAIEQPPISLPFSIVLLESLPQLFLWNGKSIQEDFILWKLNAPDTQPLQDKYTKIYAQENIWIGKNAQIWDATLNATKGPIYIGENVCIQEGAIIQGPVAILENAIISPRAIIRSETTIGAFCKVGGEVSNVNMHSYSNKSHDGFLGNAVIGSWCNLGAGTNCSNLKNNYSTVKLFYYPQRTYVPTALQFCGVIMGDHSKTSINTMLNTGTVVGIFANIFGAGFPPKWIPSFSWGGSAGFEDFDLAQAIEMARRMMQRRSLIPDSRYIELIHTLWNHTQWERAMNAKTAKP
ncbi:MAG: putative sugar nucleotidyl transferase [Bacteroidia bacterium]|nr:putative sugar nucleotidyl transferase [Bacteroidia bacterium]MDW8159797.1 putative sugar nucleotidyl transferase [Bacteroidia bacterium]